jgi:O-methyltransferase involved in polyketide biosynthesis
LLPPYLRDFHAYLRLRHHAFEARMERIAPDVVIEIAAGLSPRGLTYARRWPEITYLELDLPNMVAAKRARLKRVQLPDNYRLAETDILADDFIERLPIKPMAQQRMVVITEGLMDYLSMQEKQRAWRNVQGLLAMAAPGSRYLFESWPADRVLPDTTSGQLGLRGLSMLVGRQMGENLFANAEAVAEGLNAAGFATAVRQDLQSLAVGQAVDARRCPFVLFECA